MLIAALAPAIDISSIQKLCVNLKWFASRVVKWEIAGTSGQNMTRLGSL